MYIQMNVVLMLLGVTRLETLLFVISKTLEMMHLSFYSSSCHPVCDSSTTTNGERFEETPYQM